MKGITKAAKQANGRSQACATCPLNRREVFVYPKYKGFAQMRFVEGFKKRCKMAATKSKRRYKNEN